MPQYKVTFGWEQAVLGRTESYISKQLTDSQATDAINNLISKRNALIYNSVRWRGVRIAQVDPTTASGFRRSNFYPPGDYAIFSPTAAVNVPPTGARLPNVVNGLVTDQGRSILQIRVKYDGNRFVTRYFAWPPDGLIQNELLGLNFGGFPDWVNDYATFWNEVIANWFIRARRKPNDSLANPPIQSDILRWVTTAGPPAQMGFQLPTVPASGIERGSFVQVSNVRRRGTDRLSYNGRYKVTAVVPNAADQTTTYYLQATEDGEPESVKLNGQVYPIRYGLYPFQQALPIRGGVHKTGRPLGMPSGKRRKLVSLDP